MEISAECKFSYDQRKKQKHLLSALKIVLAGSQLFLSRVPKLSKHCNVHIGICTSSRLIPSENCHFIFGCCKYKIFLMKTVHTSPFKGVPVAGEHVKVS